MIGATFCSGIGAPEVAAPWVDWQLASEIEPFPREVLQYRHGYTDARKSETGPLGASSPQAQAVAFAQNQRDELRTMDVVGALAAEPGMKQQTFLAEPWAVRRLTPRECERLQGFPDDFTLIPRARKRMLKDVADELECLRQTYPELTEAEAIMLAADGPRYKALGNSMAVPVIRWIMDRIKISFHQQRKAAQAHYAAQMIGRLEL